MTEPPVERAPGATLARSLWYWFWFYVALALMTLLYRHRRYHMERLPRTGACLLAANHQSYLDPTALGTCLPFRPTHYLARRGLFKSRAFGWAISALNSVPVSEEGGGDVAAIKSILARLETGVPVLIFPEGSRTTDGRMQPFKRGVALLVKRARCPVVPMAVDGCYDAWPRGRPFPRLFGRRIGAIAGHPIPHDELMKDGPDAALARLAREIEALRLELRAKLRAASGGRSPRPGPADRPAVGLEGSSV